MVVISLLLFASLYAAGVTRVWSVAGIGRGVGLKETAAFSAGWLALLTALASPLHEWSEALFAAHMVQHELIMVIAAPLVAMGAPLIATLWALPRSWRRRCADGLRMGRRVPGLSWMIAPGAAFCLHAFALWAWHIPSLYEAALDHNALHTLQHLSFFGTAVLFWWTVARGQYRYGGYGASVLYVFGTAAQSGVLGALLTFSERLWYTPYSYGAAEWNLTAIQDQQLAGLVMWIPASLIFTAAGLVFLAMWLSESKRRTLHYASIPFYVEELIERVPDVDQ
jgi:cytochrome c oxidase assembly factor CtaG